MAKKRFLVVEDSYIGGALIKADERKIVSIETDIEKGGMTPGTNLVEVDEDGHPVADKSTAKPKGKAAAATTPPAGGDDLA